MKSPSPPPPRVRPTSAVKTAKKPVRVANSAQQPEEPKKPARASASSRQDESNSSTPVKSEKTSVTAKRTYGRDRRLRRSSIHSSVVSGPPQLSMFGHSDSESAVEQPTHLLQHQEEDEEDDDDDKQSPSASKEVESAVVKKTSNGTNDDEEEEEEGGGGEDGSSQGFSGFLQLLQSMTGGAVQSSSSPDDSDGIQGLLTRLGIVARQSFSFSLVELFSLDCSQERLARRNRLESPRERRATWRISSSSIWILRLRTSRSPVNFVSW